MQGASTSIIIWNIRYALFLPMFNPSPSSMNWELFEKQLTVAIKVATMKILMISIMKGSHHMLIDTFCCQQKMDTRPLSNIPTYIVKV